MLPTDNGTNIYLYEGKLYLFPDVEFHQMTRTGQHLYITVDEEIKEGDLHFNSKYGDEIRVANKRDVLSQKGWRDEDYEIRKIIATTDRKLIVMDKISYGKEAGKEVETMLPELPKSFIEEYCKAGGIDEVLVEVEYLKTPNPKFDRSKGVNKNNPTYLLDETNLVPKTRNDNTIIIHTVEEKMYSVDVMTKALIDFSNNFLKVRNQVTESEVKKWIEENL